MPSQTLITGGQGRLAQTLLRINPNALAPKRSELDLSDAAAIKRYGMKHSIDLVIHAAAATKAVLPSPEPYLVSNILATTNIALWCLRHRVRLIYISSDYVYPCERGQYTEQSSLFPINDYARSKLGGEMAVQLIPDSLVIRTSFYDKAQLNFSKACVDQWCSKVPIDEAAKRIWALANDRSVKGVLNLGDERRRTVYEIVKKECNPHVSPAYRRDFHLPYPLAIDSSLDSSLVRMPKKGMTRPEPKISSAALSVLVKRAIASVPRTRSVRGAGELVVAIGQGHESLLRIFADKGFRTLAIEPNASEEKTTNASQNRQLHIPWTLGAAQDIAARFGMAKIVTSFSRDNVLSDVAALVGGIAQVLHPLGVWVVPIINEQKFDRSALKELVVKYGIELVRVERIQKTKNSAALLWLAWCGALKRKR